MNCRKGDLAVVVRSSVGNAGRFVKVLAPLGVEPKYDGRIWSLGNSKGAFHWLVRTAGSPLNSIRGDRYIEMPMPDDCLRPLRDPGDDAADQTLEWLPSPTKEVA